MASQVIVERDLSRSLKSKHIDTPRMPVTVTLEMDDELQKLARSGKEGFRLQQLVDAANDSIDKWTDGFQDSIDVVDKKLPDLGSDEIMEKIDELNDVLVKYSKQLETQVNNAVDKEWKAILSRNQELKKYKFWSRVKIAAAVYVASANILSLVATAGADVVSALSLVNVVANLAAQAHRECMDLFKQHEALSKLMEKLDDTVRDDLSGFKDVTKSVVTDLSPALGRLLTSTKGAEVELKSLRMKCVDADKDAETTVGKINASLDKLAKIDKPGIDAKVYAKVQELEKQVDELLKGMICMRKLLDQVQDDCDEWGLALKAWNDRNPTKARIKALASASKIPSTIASVISATVKMAFAIKSLAA